MAESLVSFVAERLRDLLSQEADFLCGVSKQFGQMKTKIEQMTSLIRRNEDEAIRYWVSEIREAAYDAEDVIESFTLKIASRRRKGIQNAFKRYACVINEVIEIHKVRAEIEAINARISDLTRSLRTYGAPKSDGEGSSSMHGMQGKLLRRSYSHVVEEDIVGLDEDVKTLVDQLVGEGKNCPVVSIWGMGGLGKTTLAKEVYRHKDISSHFEGRLAWANVSQQCQPRDVWEGILCKLISPLDEKIKEEFKRLRDEELAKTLYQEQLKKKCLVILDDIWTTDAWDSLRKAFPVGQEGSKILLTTRNKDVAQHVDPSVFLYEPKFLSEGKAWRLLLKAFPEMINPDYSNNMGELWNMVQKCAGLPLAIVVLGRLLAAKHTLNERDMPHANMDLYLRRGKGLEQHQLGVYEVLAISYHELPSHLKPCFLHLGHFPEDSDIPTKKLARMWVAEGILSPLKHEAGRQEPLEDVAEHYLDELIKRCMVQVRAKGSTGRVKTCRLHKFMRDMCLLIASQENFLKIFHSKDGIEPTITKSSGPVRRLAIYQETYGNSLWERERTPHLRSLLYLSITRISQKMKSKFSNFKFLRVLDLEQCRVEEKFATAIGNLIHLRYLSLFFYNSTKLPPCIGNLRCLQTLILKTRWNDELEVPNVLYKMEQLRHLYLPRLIKESSEKLQLGNLSNLQTLQGFDANKSHARELINLTNLRKLGISEIDRVENLEGILKSPSVTFNHLRSLQITKVNSLVKKTDLEGILYFCHHLYKLYLRGPIEELPESSLFPPNLTKLILVGSELKEDPMATLEKLPNLGILHLNEDAFSGNEMVWSSKGFSQLKSLVLSRLPNLKEWRVCEESMPRFCELVIEDCLNLERVSNGSRKHTIFLQELKINAVHTKFQNQVFEEKQEVNYMPFFEDIC